jgi:outer membrane receptor protein involved in Fe transport
MRWFEYDRNQVEIYNAPLGLPAFESNATLGRVESQGKSSDTVFKFATEYKFDADRMVYLLYSEGFRLGGSNQMRRHNQHCRHRNPSGHQNAPSFMVFAILSVSVPLQ